VRCAYEIQRSSREANISRPPEGRVRLRVGVHLGDVVDSGGDISGDAVNVASRIEPLAEVEGVCLSQQVYDQIRNKFELPLESLGPRNLKNVTAPLEVFRVVMPWESKSPRPEAELDKNRIAVLPFVNISPDPTDEFFADGLTEELIAQLALVKGLKVIARTSAMNYKRKDKNISQIGRELNTGTVVEGSVRKASNRIRVTVQVIDVKTEEHLWASSYDDSLDDVFAVQRDIATKVAASLPSHLSVGAGPIPALKGTPDTQAYLLFLQGQALAYHREQEPLLEAIRFFERAIEADPSFSRAYASMARVYIRLGEEGFIAWGDAIRRGRAAAQKATSISADLAEAHSVLADLANMADDPIEVMEAEAHRALELNPNLAEGYDALGQLAARRGDLAGYVGNLEAAYQLDPLNQLTIRYLGRAYFLAGRLDDAMNFYKRTIHLDPLSAHQGMASLYFLKPDFEAAETAVREMEKLAPNQEYTLLNRGYLAALRGDRATAMKMIAKLDATHEPGWSLSSSAGYIYLALGDLDKFFEYMFTALRDHTLPLNFVRFAPLFETARKDPRFAELMSLVAARDTPLRGPGSEPTR